MFSGHVVLLCLIAAVSTLLWAAGIRASGYDDAGRWTGPPTAVPVVSWLVAVPTVALVVRAVGRRPPGRLAYWLTGTAA